ncbi:MAG: hypothetical protein ABIV43_02610 [Candidatus Saccharimonadales bacterium]
MKMPAAERRQIENEMIFRRVNEKVGIGLDKIDANNVEDGNPSLVRTDDLSLDFYCECSDELCEARITIMLSEYQKMHLDRSSFIVKLGHQDDAIEDVIQTTATYTVVNKKNATTEPGRMLNNTATDGPSDTPY